MTDYQAGASTTQLGLDHHMGKITILKLLRTAGVEMRCQGLQPEDLPEAARLYREGWSLARIGDKFGCDDGNVRKRLLEFGVQTKSRRGLEPREGQ